MTNRVLSIVMTMVICFSAVPAFAGDLIDLYKNPKNTKQVRENTLAILKAEILNAEENIRVYKQESTTKMAEANGDFESEAFKEYYNLFNKIADTNIKKELLSKAFSSLSFCKTAKDEYQIPKNKIFKSDIERLYYISYTFLAKLAKRKFADFKQHAESIENVEEIDFLNSSCIIFTNLEHSMLGAYDVILMGKSGAMLKKIVKPKSASLYRIVD